MKRLACATLFVVTFILTFLLGEKIALAYTYFDFGGDFHYSRIDAKNLSNPTTVTLLSEIQSTLHAGAQWGSYGKAWHLEYRSANYSFKPDPKLQVATMGNLKGQLNSFEISRWWRISNSWGTEFEMSALYQDHLIVDYPYLNLELVKVTLPGIGIKWRGSLWRFTENKTFANEQQTGSGIFYFLNYNLIVSFKSTAKPSIFGCFKRGIEYVQKIAGPFEAHGQIWSDTSNFSTSEYDQKNKNVGIGINFVYVPQNTSWWVRASQTPVSF
jgi:hypothetical protein